jgi:hypothetical protein
VIIHQSDLSSWIRCPAAFNYSRLGWPQEQNSAAAYGTVMHHSLLVFERLRAEGASVDSAARSAQETFVHYWNPINIDSLTEPVKKWLPRQSYGGLRAKGIKVIGEFADLVRYDDAELLATEYAFQVPIQDTWDELLGEPHILAGSIDRLVARRYKRHLVLGVDDYKSGKEYTYLRQNLQFTAYCYASTTPEFWSGWRGEDGFGERGPEMHQRFSGAARRGTWINLKQLKFQDAGWRGPKDYKRFAVAVNQVAASIQADIYPMTLVGEVCTFCPFRENCCGVGVAEDAHGAPGSERSAA